MSLRFCNLTGKVREMTYLLKVLIKPLGERLLLYGISLICKFKKRFPHVRRVGDTLTSKSYKQRGTSSSQEIEMNSFCLSFSFPAHFHVRIVWWPSTDCVHQVRKWIVGAKQYRTLSSCRLCINRWERNSFFRDS